jgi:ribosomal protein S11
LSGAGTLCKFSGGNVVKADRDEATRYTAMLAQQAVARLNALGINGLHVKIAGKGGVSRRLPAQGPRARGNEAREDRGRHAAAARFDAADGRAPRSPSLDFGSMHDGTRIWPIVASEK